MRFVKQGRSQSPDLRFQCIRINKYLVYCTLSFFQWLLSLFFTSTSTSQVILPTPSITVHTGRTMTSPVSGNWSFCLHPCSLISCSLHSNYGDLKMYSISLWLNYFCMLSFLTESKSLLVGGLSTYLLLGLLRLPIFARNALPYCIQKWPTSWGA